MFRVAQFFPAMWLARVLSRPHTTLLWQHLMTCSYRLQVLSHSLAISSLRNSLGMTEKWSCQTQFSLPSPFIIHNLLNLFNEPDKKVLEEAAPCTMVKCKGRGKKQNVCWDIAKLCHPKPFLFLGLKCSLQTTEGMQEEIADWKTLAWLSIFLYSDHMLWTPTSPFTNIDDSGSWWSEKLRYMLWREPWTTTIAERCKTPCVCSCVRQEVRRQCWEFLLDCCPLCCFETVSLTDLEFII